MKVNLTQREKFTLTALKAFPVALFEGPVIERLKALGLVAVAERGELVVTARGRTMAAQADRQRLAFDTDGDAQSPRASEEERDSRTTSSRRLRS